MGRAARFQVDDAAGTAVVYLTRQPTAEDLATAREVLGDALAQARPDELLAVLIREIADEDAYERVCRARGLLL